MNQLAIISNNTVFNRWISIQLIKATISHCSISSEQKFKISEQPNNKTKLTVHVQKESLLTTRKSFFSADWSSPNLHSGLPILQTSAKRRVEVVCPKSARYGTHITLSSSRCSFPFAPQLKRNTLGWKGNQKMENSDAQPAGNCQTKTSQVSFATCRRFLGSSMAVIEDEQLAFPFIFTPTVSSPQWSLLSACSLSWIVLFEKLRSHFVWGGRIFRTTDRSQSIWLSAPFSQMLWASQMLWLPQFYIQMLWLRSVGDDVPAWSPKNRKNQTLYLYKYTGKVSDL